ncbi:H-NS histone family protein [Cupriavidus gilardii]|uniref:H-NS family nucleoid-associated regulatory protein n=1 Tax=Cupriavidus gilardii TaxID=82541 RepID=UPI0021BF4BB2|nr:H-NS family nucleoid-associated regulatory protein [Cupriavidus gilardii]MCT9070566.1 H-NS histone family protein [Cupriavidus gilardii]
MSEFDEARLAAAAWVRAQMDRYGLSLDDLVAAGCFPGSARTERGRAADTPTSATPAPSSAAPSAATPAANESAPPEPAGVLYRSALGQCWDGTGEMPDWLQRAVNAGQTPEFYRVS